MTATLTAGTLCDDTIEGLTLYYKVCDVTRGYGDTIEGLKTYPCDQIVHPARLLNYIAISP